MNITCPKCGFEQPNDRFCANCGVNMENFKPPSKSIVQTLLASSLFYGVLALIMAGGALYLVTKTISKRTDTINAPDYSVSGRTQGRPLETAPVPAAESPTVAATAHLGATPGPTLSPAGTIMPTANPLGATSKSSEAALLAAKSRKHSIKVTWAEVSKDYFIELFGESLPYGNFTAGILMEEFNNRSLKSRLELGRNEKMIRTFESTSYPLNLGEGEKRIEIKMRSRDPKVNEKVGVDLNLEPVHLDEAGLQLRFEVRRALPILQGQRYGIDPFNVSDEILIPLRGAAFLSGFLTHREPYDETEQKLFQGNSALKVLNSKMFQANQSEIVVLIEVSSSD